MYQIFTTPTTLKERFLPKFPADRDESATFRTVWPPVLILILDGSLPSEAEEEMGVVRAVLPASAFMGLPSNSFFILSRLCSFQSWLAVFLSIQNYQNTCWSLMQFMWSHQTRGSSTDLFWITASLLASFERLIESMNHTPNLFSKWLSSQTPGSVSS